MVVLDSNNTNIKTKEEILLEELKEEIKYTKDRFPVLQNEERIYQLIYKITDILDIMITKDKFRMIQR